MINFKEVSKKIDNNLILDQLSFDVKQGEILGFLGPNGAGKTTTMKIITGYWRPSQGEISVAGINLAQDSLAVRKKIGYLPETVPLYDEMKVFEYLKFVAEMRGIPKEKIIIRIKQVVKDCGLQTVIGRSIEELSKGYRQRVGLAQAIMHNPEILILDEPTTGLDPNQIAEIRDLIKEIGKKKTVIFSTHILAEAQATCDRVIIINHGKIVGQGRPEELANKLQHNFYHLKIKNPQNNVQTILHNLPNVLTVIKKESTTKIQAENQDNEIRQNDIVAYELQVRPGVDSRENIAKAILDNHWLVLEFSKQEATLEEVFRELTK